MKEITEEMVIDAIATHEYYANAKREMNLTRRERRALAAQERRSAKRRAK